MEKKSLSEQLTEAKAQIAALNSERDEARTEASAKAQDLAAALADKDKLAADLKAAQDALAAEQSALQSAAQEINALKDAQKDFDAKVAAKAQEQLAAIGVPAVDADKPQPPAAKSIAELTAEMQKLPEKERAGYFDKHIAPKLK